MLARILIPEISKFIFQTLKTFKWFGSGLNCQVLAQLWVNPIKKPAGDSALYTRLPFIFEELLETKDVQTLILSQ